jgi:hypothetical protein
MTELLSLFLKYVLPILGVIAVLFGVYEYGQSQGYNKGYTVAWNTQQTTINNMVTANSLAATTMNGKITTLEQNAAQDASDLFAANVKAATVRNTVVTKYKVAYPKIAASCGLDPVSTNAVNAIIDSDGMSGQTPATASTTNSSGEVTDVTILPDNPPASKTINKQPNKSHVPIPLKNSASPSSGLGVSK